MRCINLRWTNDAETDIITSSVYLCMRVHACACVWYCSDMYELLQNEATLTPPPPLLLLLGESEQPSRTALGLTEPVWVTDAERRWRQRGKKRKRKNISPLSD